MANRYLRASGNWNDPVWAATSDGVAGSASTPTASDVVIVLANYTLTLNTDITVNTLALTNGTFNANNYNVTINNQFEISGGTAKTLNMGNGTWTCNIGSGGYIDIGSFNTTLNASTSNLVVNASDDAYIALGNGLSYNDVRLNLGVGNSNSIILDILGSLTFRSLIIQSKNSAAHTVNFDSNVSLDKFVAIGSSSQNRLKLDSANGMTVSFPDYGTSYGQYVHVTDMVWSNAGGGFYHPYIGANSIDDSAAWLTQDPPKISTLVDPLTTAPGSNPNWTVSGTVTQVTSGYEGGGYNISSGGQIVTVDTFDLVDSHIVIERIDSPTGNPKLSINDDSATVTIDGMNGLERGTLKDYTNSSNTAYSGLFTLPFSGSKFMKLSLTASTGKLLWQVSDDGEIWTDKSSIILDASSLLYYRSVRISVYSTGTYKVGSINPSFNTPPTTTLNSPANNTQLTTTTPTLAFTATDPEGDDVTYEVQIDDNSGFSSPDSFMSAEDAGFSGTDPYDSGTQVTYTVQSALTKGGIDYYWRVRAKDPNGSDSWGAWSATRKMTTEALPPSVTSGSSSSVATTSATVSGNVTATNGANITERGFVYATTSNPTTANSKKTVSGTTGSFNASLTGLTSNTTYYWRAYATNSKGTTYGDNKSFTTEPITPTVTTGTASGTSTSGFTVSASGVTANPDSQTINEYGVVYSTSQNPTIADSSQTGTGTSADFDTTLSGLSENTTYYVRAYIKWRGSDYAYGSQISFKTQGRPVVTLDAPANAATVSGILPTLDFTGTDADTNTITYQLQLHTSDVWTAPTLDVLSASNAGFSNRSDSKTDPFYSGNQIRYTVQSALTRGQTYYWRVRGKDTNGSDTWGEWTTARSFTVPATTPTVSIGSVSNVTFDTADISADVTSDGGATVTERGVVYATTQNPTTADSKKTVAGTTGEYVAELTDLAGTTTYYVRAYATNSEGTTYSSQVSFTTLQTPSAPTVVTGQAANTTDITSEFNGSEVILDGTEDVVERGIVFSDTNDTPTTDDRKIVAPSGGLGVFDLGMTGLDPSTTYYVRAYAINSIGTGYGDVETFTTEAPFVPDEGDGYWTWTPSGSDAVVGRSQSTPKNSSVDLMLADLGLEDDTDYTFYYSAKDSNNGETKVVLQWYDSAVKQQQEIAPDTPYTFTYDEDMDYWAIRLFVTGDSAEAENITATFNDMYLAQESEFSGFVPFVANGVTEVKIENNWLIDKQRADVITTMFDAIEGDAWYPFNITTEGLGWFEIGDRFTIQDADENDYSVVLWESKLTVDGGISESLKAKTPDLTETNYHKAGKLNGLWKRTQIEVDKNAQEIESLVEAVYDYDGVINTQFSEVFQDIDQVRTTIQGSGGVNLIKNSVMYAFDSDGVPESWAVAGTGSLLIQSSPESLTAGAVAGNAFTLSDETVTQTITVRKDVDFIPEDNKTYYSFSAKVKKNTVGEAHIKLINRNETLTIDLPDQEGYYWDTVKLEEILPLDDHYDIEIYSDSDAELQVTDVIFAPGKTKREWTQANGEVMNLSTTITEEGLTIRSPQFPNDYTKMDALGFEVHSKEVGGDRVFGFNKDETNVHKLKADKQISMTPLRVVPIDYDGYKGWAFTPSKEDS